MVERKAKAEEEERQWLIDWLAARLESRTQAPPPRRRKADRSVIARAGSGWQTVLADLSLILFMVMAAAVSDAHPARLETRSQSATRGAVARGRRRAGADRLVG